MRVSFGSKNLSGRVLIRKKSIVVCTHGRIIERQQYPAPRSRFMWWLLRSTMRRQYLPSSYALRVRDRCSLFVYVKRGELSLMNDPSYKIYRRLPKNRRHPLQGAFWARSMGLAGQPGIPPTAAPPEASYRRPEDIIVLSHMPRVTRDAYTKYICVHHFLIGRGTLDRMPLNARSMGLAGQPGIPPTAAPPLPPHLKG